MLTHGVARYNEMDAHFLKALNITKADSPAGFQFLTPQSLLYTPSPEFTVIMHALFQKPSTVLSNPLDYFYRNESGEARSRSWSLSIPAEGKERTLDEIKWENDPKEKGVVKKAENTLESYCQFMEEFQAARKMTALPDLDDKDHSFYKMRIYWRTEKDQGTE